MRKKKRAICFGTLLPNELKSYVVRFTTHVQNYLAMKQVDAT